MTMTIIKLNRVYVKSNAISKRTREITRRTKRRAHAVGIFRNLRVDNKRIQPITAETLNRQSTHALEQQQSSPQQTTREQLEKHRRPDDDHDDDVTIEQPAE